MPAYENEGQRYQREDFDAFLREIEELSHSPEPISPLRIASPPFDMICDTIHLAWIRQELSAKIKEQQPKNMMLMALMHTAHVCKSSLWTIDEGIHVLMNESAVLITPSNQSRGAEIAHHVRQAKQACLYGDLKSTTNSNESFIVKPKDLLIWAEKNHVPVNPDIAREIRNEHLGRISQRPNNGWQPRPQEAHEMRNEWQEAALELEQNNPHLSKSAIAEKIAKSPIGKCRSPETIRKSIKLKAF